VLKVLNKDDQKALKKALFKVKKASSKKAKKLLKKYQKMLHHAQKKVHKKKAKKATQKAHKARKKKAKKGLKKTKKALHKPRRTKKKACAQYYRLLREGVHVTALLRKKMTKPFKFKDGQTTLSRSSLLTLASVASVLRKHPKVLINLQTHTPAAGARGSKIVTARLKTVATLLQKMNVKNVIMPKGLLQSQKPDLNILVTPPHNKAKCH